MCPQPPLSGIDEPDHDVLSEMVAQVHDDSFEILAINARGSEDHLAGVAAESSTHVEACEPPATRKLANGLET